MRENPIKNLGLKRGEGICSKERYFRGLAVYVRLSMHMTGCNASWLIGKPPNYFFYMNF